MPRRNRNPGSRAVLAILAVLALTGCSQSAGSDGGGERRQNVGWASVRYPHEWTVLAKDQRPQGWQWAAQDGPDQQAGAQLAVDGEYSHQPDVEMSVANLLAAAQVGSYPDFKLGDKRATSIPGAAQAVRASFTYRVDGTDYDAVWVVARAQDSRTVVVQLSGKHPLDPQLTEATVAGVRVLGAT